MITEHNHQELFLLEISTPDGPRWLDGNRRLTRSQDAACLFVHPEDAKRWTLRAGLAEQSLLVKIEFPFRLEYQYGPIWQGLRYYRTPEAAHAGWQANLEKAATSPLYDRVWRLTNVLTGEILIEDYPEEVNQ